jgi:hypothetical protein
MKFGVFLLALVEPLLAKILIALGFSVVSIVGVEAVVGQLKSALIGSMNGLPSDMLQFALLLGIGKALGMIFGAVTTKLTLWAIENSVKLIGKNPG